MKFDLMNSLDPKRALSPAAAVTDNTAQVSQILDMQGAHSAMLIIILGALADANATFTVLVEHGDDSGLSDAAAVPDSELNGTEALAGFQFDDDDEVRKIGYVGSKRYVRATITPAGNTGNAFVAAVWLRGMLEDAPAANPPA